MPVSEFFQFRPEFFYFFLLPPIILESGYSLDRQAFLTNLVPILIFAIFGTLVAMFVIAEGVYYMDFGFVGPPDLRFGYAWLLGCILSAVDPVATLSILGGSRFAADETLFAIVFGESILNDAVAIVLYKTAESIFMGQSKVKYPSAATLLLECFNVTVISVLVATVIVTIAQLAFRASSGLKRFPEYELGLILLSSYFSFSLGEYLNGSGILTLFLIGVFLGHWSL